MTSTCAPIESSIESPIESPTSTHAPRKSFVDNLFEIFSKQINKLNSNKSRGDWAIDLSRNPNITMADVIKYKEIKWSSVYLSFNPAITFEEILNHPEIDWCYPWVTANPNVDMKIIEAHPEIQWDYKLMSMNKSLTFETVMKYDVGWDLDDIFCHQNMTIENLKILSKKIGMRWSDTYSIEENPNLTWEDIISLPDYIWDYRVLSAHPNITWQIICDNPDKQWNYTYLSRNINITIDIVVANPNKQWNFVYLSANPNITWEHIMANPNLQWNFVSFARNPNITIKQLKKIKANRKSGQFVSNVKLLENYSNNKLCRHSFFQSQQYRRPLAKRRHDQMYGELIQRACHPGRSVFSWNEGAAEEMPAEYTAECRRWRDLHLVKISPL
jgi:hypothetical protein